MLKSIWSCIAHVHVEISHAKDYHVYEQIYMIAVNVVNFFYMISHHIICLFVYIICTCMF